MSKTLSLVNMLEHMNRHQSSGEEWRGDRSLFNPALKVSSKTRIFWVKVPLQLAKQGASELGRATAKHLFKAYASHSETHLEHHLNADVMIF